MHIRFLFACPTLDRLVEHVHIFWFQNNSEQNSCFSREGFDYLCDTWGFHCWSAFLLSLPQEVTAGLEIYTFAPSNQHRNKEYMSFEVKQIQVKSVFSIYCVALKFLLDLSKYLMILTNTITLPCERNTVKGSVQNILRLLQMVLNIILLTEILTMILLSMKNLV